MRIICVGVSHKTADIGLRERLMFNEAGERRALLALRERFPGVEFVVLGTCNRSEIYCARPVHGHPRDSELVAFLAQFHRQPAEDFAAGTYTLADDQAVSHLFRVACGLESLVLGESQVLAQVKNAYNLSVEMGLSAATFNPLFQLSFNVAKHAQTETEISAGRTSVGGAAVDLAESILGERFRDGSLTVQCIGAGKMSWLMLRRLRELGCGRFLILNRSVAHARELAERLSTECFEGTSGACQAEAGSLDELPEKLSRADLVVTSTGSSEPIVTREMVEAAQQRRARRPLLIVDIAVPRDVAAEAAAVPGVRLCNIDDLSEVVQASAELRARQVQQCEQIVAEHVKEFNEFVAAQEVAPTIKALRRRLRHLADQELLAAVRKLSTHDDSAEDQRILQRAMHRLVQRILHDPTENLRRHGSSEAARVHAAALRKLFDLESEESAGHPLPDGQNPPKP